MTGSRKVKKIPPPPPPVPTPQPILGREEDEARKKVRKKRRGREANILAGRLTSQRNDILKVRLG
jgi:hypothetical protein